MKNQAKKKAEWSNLEGDWIIYRACKNTLKSLIRQAKLQFVSSSISCTKFHPHVAAQLWSRINIVLNRSTSPLASYDASIPPDTLNNFFQTVAVTPLHQPARRFVLPDDDHSGGGFSFNGISVDTVFRHLSTLDVQKSAGPDGLSACFLKEIAVELLHRFLIYIICHCSGELCHMHGSSLILLPSTSTYVLICNAASDWPRTFFTPRVFLFSIRGNYSLQYIWVTCVQSG